MENLNKKRLFIALNLPADVKKKIEEIINDLATRNKGIRWVKAAGLHLNLHFLGNLNSLEENKVKLIMESLAGKYGEMVFRLERVDAFPNIIAPRVIYLASRQKNGDTVFKLQTDLGSQLNKAGFTTDKRPWKLHLTLGRVKKPAGSIKTKANYPALPVNFKVASFELIKSDLKPDGAVYSQVISYKLSYKL